MSSEIIGHEWESRNLIYRHLGSLRLHYGGGSTASGVHPKQALAGSPRGIIIVSRLPIHAVELVGAVLPAIRHIKQPCHRGKISCLERILHRTLALSRGCIDLEIV